MPNKPASSFRRPLGAAPLKHAKPVKPVANKNVSLVPSYGLAFGDPASMAHVGAAEHAALQELYQRQTGTNLSDQPDVKEALTRGGLLHGVGGARGAVAGAGGLAALRKGTNPNPVFVSAMDALDYLGRQTGSFLSDNSKERQRKIAKDRKNLNPAQEAVKGAFDFVGNKIAAGAEAAWNAPGIPLPKIDVNINTANAGLSQVGGISAGELASPKVSDLAKADISLRPQRVGQNIHAAGSLAGQAAVAGIEAAAGPISRLPSPIQSLGGMRIVSSPTGQLYTPTQPTLTLGDISAGYQDMAENPNQYVDASPVDMSPLPGIAKANVAKVNQIVEAVRNGATLAQTDQMWGDTGLTGLSNMTKISMRNRAKQNGWDDAQWKKLSIADQIYRSNTNNDLFRVTLRSAVRTLGMAGSTPAGIKAATEAAALSMGGDTEQAGSVIESVLGPYATFRDQNQRLGKWAAFQTFASQNPQEFLLAVNAAGRLGSVGAGAVFRSGAIGTRAAEYGARGRNITASGASEGALRDIVIAPPREVPVPPLGGRLGRAAALRQQQRVNLDYRAVEEVLNRPVELSVGYTGRGLLGTFILTHIKKKIAESNNRFGAGYRASLYARKAGRGGRFAGNIAQGVETEIQNALLRGLGVVPDEMTRQRYAFSLMWPKIGKSEGATGAPIEITPGTLRDYFLAQIDDLEKTIVASEAEAEAINVALNKEGKIGNVLPKINRREQQKQLDLWRSQSRFFDVLDKVPVKQEIVDRLREVAKPFGERNTEIVASVLNITNEEAKRGNYIRLAAMDPAFEVGAQALKVATNVSGKAEFIMAQRAVRRLSERIQLRLTDKGYRKFTKDGKDAGFHPAAESLRQYNKDRVALIKALDTAEKRALEYGQEDLAVQYRAAREKIQAAGYESRSRMQGVQDQLKAVLDLSVESAATQADDVRVPVQPMTERLWSETIANRGPVESATSNVVGATVEMVRASELRGMEGNATTASKVAELRGQTYENPIIIDYDPRTGFAYISEGNNRLAAAADDQFIPVQVLAGKVDPAVRTGARQITEPNVLFDRSNYVPSNLYPHEIGIPVRGVNSKGTVADLPVEVQAPYLAAQAADVALQDATAVAAETLAATGKKRVDSRMIGLVQQNIELLKRDIAAQENMGIPDPKRYETLNWHLNYESRVLEGYTVAREAQAALAPLAQTRKAALAQVNKVIKENTPVLDSDGVIAAVDATAGLASVRIVRAKELGYYSIAQARGEVLDDFIARVEASDQGAVLHLMQRGEFENLGTPIRVTGGNVVEATATTRVQKGRFIESQGNLFTTGQEASGRMWQQLLVDTAELQSAEAWKAHIEKTVDAISVVVRFKDGMLQVAKAQAERDVANGVDPDVALTGAIKDQINALGIEYTDEFTVVNLRAPNALKPSNRVSLGVIPDYAPDSIADIMYRTLNERTIDPAAPGDYYLIPTAAYKALQKAIENESFRFEPGSKMARADEVVRAWRNVQLNVLPRTGFNNIVGSIILAIQAGAGPRSFYYAARALTDPKSRLGLLLGSDNRVFPVPRELRQRYYDQVTSRVGSGNIGGKRNQGVSLDNLPGPASDAVTALEYGMAGVSWWMNNMRRFNGLSEDFGRLAVWYSKAYPAAMREAELGNFMLSARRLNDNAVGFLEQMATGDPRWAASHEQWMQQSFDFLGDLHRGGQRSSVIRIAIPFWQWYAHMIKLTMFTMPVKYPGRALFLEMLGRVGDDYQQSHGVLAPYLASYVPFYSDKTMINGQPQWVTNAIDTSAWYPQATVAPLGQGQGEFGIGAIGFAEKAFTPGITNLGLLVGSLFSAAGGGSAIELDDQGFIRAAKDEFGNPIGLDSQMLNYAAHLGYLSFPLSATFMDTVGRASTSYPFHVRDKPPTDRLKLDKQHYDLWSRISDPLNNLPSWALKMTTGVKLWSQTPGQGPITYQKNVRDYEFLVEQMNREENLVRKILMQLHTGE
ncbi:hypothetical protein UFOVP1158_42 [uncultured Caudovirales phage]|uniref:Uncharacterized protein n=1 Tax=uncultured Caudovirales phage TaxID=2100421 RepID=A0A6J5R4H3_9CAUD|nr:hypothetical protein UFOVP1158_42 [uncultured Caudovirales phage]